MYYYEEETDPRAARFVGLSAFLHASIVAFVLTIKIVKPEIISKPIEIEILPPPGQQMQTPLVHEVKAPEPQLPAPPKPHALPKVREVVKREKALRPKVAAVRPSQIFKSQGQSPRSAKVAEIPLPSFETPELEAPKFDSPELAEETLQEDFEKVDRESQMKVAATARQISQSQKKAFLAHEDSLSEVMAETQKESERMATESKRRRAQEFAAAQALSEARANAIKEAAARRRAELAAAAASEEAARRARLAAIGAKSRGANSGEESEVTSDGAELGHRTGEGASAPRQGPAGSSLQAKYGIPGGVRSLEELRQRPGNKRPQYDYDDRLRGRQGAVVYLAFITKEGSPTTFKMVKSTGYAQLDSKTLEALKSWKFYPGQEGWVEIPFKWDLKGGPQEMPATLRRKFSQRF